MNEESPKYETTSRRGRIELCLWPKGYLKQGRRTIEFDVNGCPNPLFMVLEIVDAELLAAEWERQPYQFEQEGARSIKTTLREYEQAITGEDMSDAED